MAGMGVSDGGYVAGVPRGGQPVAHGGAYSAAKDGRLPRGRLAGDEEQHPHSRRNRAVQPVVQQRISGGKVVAVKVHGHFWLDQASAKAPIPTAVQGGSRRSPRRRCRFGGRLNARLGLGPHRSSFCLRRWWGRFSGPNLERLYRLDNPRPKHQLLISEPTCRHCCSRSAGRPCLWAPERRRCRGRTFRPRAAPLRLRRPRRCRSGWRP